MPTECKSRHTLASVDSKQLRRHCQLQQRFEVNLNCQFLNWYILPLLRHHTAAVATANAAAAAFSNQIFHSHFLVFMAIFCTATFQRPNCATM